MLLRYTNYNGCSGKCDVTILKTCPPTVAILERRDNLGPTALSMAADIATTIYRKHLAPQGYDPRIIRWIYYMPATVNAAEKKEKLKFDWTETGYSNPRLQPLSFSDDVLFIKIKPARDASSIIKVIPKSVALPTSPPSSPALSLKTFFSCFWRKRQADSPADATKPVPDNQSLRQENPTIVSRSLPDMKICRATTIEGFKQFAICLVKPLPGECPYATDFGDGMFCQHPKHKEIAARTRRQMEQEQSTRRRNLTQLFSLPLPMAGDPNRHPRFPASLPTNKTDLHP